MIGKHILEATVAAREDFEKEPSISLAMTWAYNVSRLVHARIHNSFDSDEVDAEIAAYIQYKS